jgi:hypothetical protein
MKRRRYNMEINFPERDLEDLIESYDGDKDYFRYWIKEYSQPFIQRWFDVNNSLIFDDRFRSYMIRKFNEWHDLKNSFLRD